MESLSLSLSLLNRRFVGRKEIWKIWMDSTTCEKEKRRNLIQFSHSVPITSLDKEWNSCHEQAVASGQETTRWETKICSLSKWIWWTQGRRRRWWLPTSSYGFTTKKRTKEARDTRDQEKQEICIFHLLTYQHRHGDKLAGFVRIRGNTSLALFSHSHIRKMKAQRSVLITKVDDVRADGGNW